MSYFKGFAHNSATAVRVIVSAPEHPELDRTIEAPNDAPDAWIANAFLLSIGEDPLPYDDAERFALPFTYASSRWPWYGGHDDGPASRTFTLPGVPYELEAEQVHTRTPAVGEAKVAIIRQDELSDHVSTTPAREHGPDAAHANWQSSAGSLDTREVNVELAAQYGVVQPRVDHSLVNDLGPGVRSGCLLLKLPPVRRLTLRVHLRGGGLLDRPVFSEADVDDLSEGLRVLIDRIGHDGVEQSEDGWLPDDVLQDVERMLREASTSQGRSVSAHGADATAGAALLAKARALRLIRRFKGRIVLTNLAKGLRADPKKIVGLLEAYVALGPRRSMYDYYSHTRESEAAVALTLLSIADGTATCRAEVPDVVARGVAVLKRNRDEYGYGYEDEWPRYFGNDAPFSEHSIAHTVSGVLDRLTTTDGTEPFSEFTLAERRLAHAALL